MNIKPPQWFIRWLERRAAKAPAGDLYDDVNGLYMRRGWLLHYQNWTGIGIRLHKTMRSDADRELHDHPWRWNISWVLSPPGYLEVVPVGQQDVPEQDILAWGHRNDETPGFVRIHRRFGDIVFRRSDDQHRLELFTDRFHANRSAPVLSLFIMGPYDKGWGFFRHGVKVPYRQFLSEKQHAYTGCGAVQFSDLTSCEVCGMSWDTNDPDPPACPLKGAHHG